GFLLGRTDRHADRGKFFGGSIEVFERLARANPQKPTYRLHLVDSYLNYGAAQGAAGQAQEAVNAYRRGLALAEKLVAEFPNEAVYRAYLGHFPRHLALMPGEVVPNAEKEQFFLKAAGVYAELANARPKEAAFRTEAVRLQLDLGQLRRQIGR